MIKQFYFKQFNSAYHLFAFSLNVKQFYLTHREDPIRCYYSRPEWTWEWWQWRGILHSSKLQHYWSLTFRLFSVIQDTCWGWVLPLCRDPVSVFYSSNQLGLILKDIIYLLIVRIPEVSFFSLDGFWLVYACCRINEYVDPADVWNEWMTMTRSEKASRLLKEPVFIWQEITR